MADKKWTKPQMDFINSQKGPILVSAAAGSGKTSAIVERVANRLCDEKNPMPADKLLMTTFSVAAADEMLTRIEAILDKKSAEMPENEFIASQCERINEAQIGTIHSFCFKMIRENFSHLDLSCDFRVADENETEMIMYSCADKVVKDAYAEDDENFYLLVENICNSKNDMELAGRIIKTYGALIAMPFPLDIIEKWLDEFDASQEGYQNYTAPIIERCQRIVRFALQTCLKCVDVIADSSKSAFISEDITKLKEAEKRLEQGDIPNAYKDLYLVQLSNRAIPRSLDEESKYFVKTSRENARKMLSDARDILSDISFETYSREQEILKPIIAKLFELVKAFMKEYAEAKKEKNILDFSDAEQFMLSLLWQKEGQEYVKTPLARELSKRYSEIYIDEYQDVNAAQEMIFKAITDNESNLFMVGDVKQSIYGFRHADADIFEEKKKEFCFFNGKKFPAKVFFDSNFRSRKSVTDFINDIFFNIMIDGTGAGEYTEGDSLKAGAVYQETQGEGASFLFYEAPKGSREKAWLEYEAKIIANEIKRLVDSKYMVTENGELRPCRYSDFCILSRSGKDKFSVYYDALNELGIEAVLDRSGGDFLESREMLLVLSLLKTINNPYDDVSLCASLLSPVFMFTPEDLAAIRAGDKKGQLYASVKKSAENGNEKCIEFLRKLSQMRNLAASGSVDSLLCAIYDRYSVYHLVGALTGGEERMNNLDIFRVYARQFEQSGYKGLSEFLRFIKKIQDNSKKLAGAQSLSENKNAVQIMTVHKSKGLEFPICIIANTTRAFNFDSSEIALFDKKIGFSCRINDVENAVRYSPLCYKACAAAKRQKQIAEEMRLLYVALTRAKEKIIIPIVKTSIDSFVQDVAVNRNVDFGAAAVSEYKSWASWFMYALSNSKKLSSAFGYFIYNEQNIMHDNFGVEFAPEIDDVGEKAEKEAEAADSEIIKKLKALSEYVYPYNVQSQISSKVSVSEISKGEGEVFDFESKPDFMHSESMTGAQRGTALHTFMQYADYSKAAVDAEKELDRMVEEGFITAKQRSVIETEKVKKFFDSPLCKRLLCADAFLREYKFMTGIDSSEFGGVKSAEDTVILQGVADCVIIEGQNATIVDYKTDYVKSEDELIERYSMQLSLYKEAIQKLTGLDVKECIIYSFCLNKEIKL